MLYVRPPSEEQRADLRRMTRQEVGRVSQRAQMVLLSAQRRTGPEIAALFETSPATGRGWLRRFAAAGPAGLWDAPRRGRPRQVTPRAARGRVTLLRQDPQQAQADDLATCWPVAMPVLPLGLRLGRRLRARTLRTALHRLDLRWRRPRLAMPRKTDPRKAENHWRIVEAVLAAGPQAAVLYADESRVQTLPLVRAMWSWAGQQWRVPTPGPTPARARFGALELRTGQWTYLVRQRTCTADFLACLEPLLVGYPAHPSILIVDNYSSHTAGDVQAWLAAPPGCSATTCRPTAPISTRSSASGCNSRTTWPPIACTARSRSSWPAWPASSPR
jgi:transposase